MAIDRFTVVAAKSTAPVGAIDKVERIIAETRPAAEYVVPSNSDFLREGAAIEAMGRTERAPRVHGCAAR